MTGPASAAPPPRPLRGGVGDEVSFVTGEAVLIDIPPAPVPQRVVSGLIDLVAYVALLILAIWFLFTQLSWLSGASASAASLVTVIGCLFIAPMTIETLTRGRSLGKVIMSLRTVRDDTGPIIFRHAFVRALLGMIEIFGFSGVPALIAALCTTRAKRLGDLAAGTYVVRLERLRPIPAAPPMPVPLASWAASGDIAPLPDGLAVSIRQFLLRRGQLAPQARARLAHTLMVQVAPRVSPPPPADAPVEAVLTAVLAETRRRDGLRLAADQQVRHRLLGPDPLAGPPPTPSPARSRV